MSGWRADELGDMARIVLAVLAPVVGLAGAGIMITYGFVGWLAVFGTICVLGVRMSMQERRRVQTAVWCLPPPSSTPKIRLPTFPTHGEVHFQVTGHLRWSAHGREIQDGSWPPLRITGALGLQVDGTLDGATEAAGDEQDLNQWMAQLGTTESSLYRVTPTDGSTWEVEIIQAAGQYSWKLSMDAMEIESPDYFSTEDHALNAAVRYILDVEPTS